MPFHRPHILLLLPQFDHSMAGSVRRLDQHWLNGRKRPCGGHCTVALSVMEAHGGNAEQYSIMFDCGGMLTSSEAAEARRHGAGTDGGDADVVGEL